MSQLALDLTARVTDPITSHLAGQPRPARITDRDRALAALARAGERGLTDFELADRIGRVPTSSGKRRLELQRLGLVENAGTTRPSPTGSAALVWRITDAGQRAADTLAREVARG